MMEENISSPIFLYHDLITVYGNTIDALVSTCIMERNLAVCIARHRVRT